MSSVGSGPGARLSFFLGSKGFPRGRSRVLYIVEHRDPSGAWREEARFGALPQAERSVDEFVSERHGVLSDYRVVEGRNPRWHRRVVKHP